eukprot:4314436-Alexandrium_andersonii.AAC.1
MIPAGFRSRSGDVHAHGVMHTWLPRSSRCMLARVCSEADVSASLTMPIYFILLVAVMCPSREVGRAAFVALCFMSACSAGFVEACRCSSG